MPSRRFLDAWEQVDEAAPSRLSTAKNALYLNERRLTDRQQVLNEFLEGGADMEGEETEPARAALRVAPESAEGSSKEYISAVAAVEIHRAALSAMVETINTAKIILTEQSKAYERRMELETL